MLKHNRGPEGDLDDDLDGPDSAEALERLRLLLLGTERDNIRDVDQRLSRVETFHSDLDERRRVIAEVLIPALDDAAYHQPDGIAEALGPSIGAGIRHEMENSREEMVAALHPLAGRLVTSAVSDSFVRLTEQVNQRIEALMSPRGMMLRAKATLTGQSIGSLLLSELNQSELQRIYLFERRDMALKFTWPETAETSAPAPHLLEEICDTVQTLSEIGGTRDDMPLRSVDLDGKSLVFQGSRSHFVVIESDGKLTAERKTELSAACLSLLDFASRNHTETGAALNTKAMTIFAQRLSQPGKAAKGKAKGGINPFYVILGLALLALIGWLGWRSYEAMQLDNRAEAIESRIHDAFRDGDIVLDVETDRTARRISVEGIGFGAANRDELYQQSLHLAAPYDLDFSLAVRDVDGAVRQQSALDRELATTRAELRDARQALADLSFALREQNERILRFDPAQPMTAWMSTNAIYFSDDADFRAPESSAAKLDRLAEFMRVLPEQRVLVVGHTDRLGSPALNRELALRRANRVIDEMTARGIDPSRFEARNAPAELKAFLQEPGPDSPNRRVEFAPAYPGE